jgi:Asp/Glu/hydantoin racemase
MQRIVVINPNSSERVTDGISAALEPLRLPGGPAIEVVRLPDGPPGIETQRHVDDAGALLVRYVQANRERADAFVVACFSDPGLHGAREATSRPVLGIAECGLLTAMTLGNFIGVIAILPGSVARHWRYIRAMGIESRVVGDFPIGIGIAGLADENTTLARMTDTGRRLIEERGANVLVMGCAGMARFRERMEQALGVPVIDPSQAAATMALGAVRFGWRSTIERARAAAAE